MTPPAVRRLGLSPRLQLLADWVPPGARLADVGTDHAYLPVWLRLHGRVVSAIACDLREGPLARARETGRTYGADAVDYRLGDGLAVVSPEEADTVVIAGMGGETIAHILESWPHAKDPGITWLLQPMTKAERLRDRLWAGGFSVLRERCAVANRRVYSVMEVRYTGEVRPHPEWERRLGAVDPGEDGNSLRYARRRAEELDSIASGLEETGDPEKLARGRVLRQAAGEIRRRIEEGRNGDEHSEISG